MKPAALACPIDDYDCARFARAAETFGSERYGYAVTPNADHLIRLHEDPAFRSLYADAAFVLLDSRWIGHLLSLFRGQKLPICTGSDLVSHLVNRVIRPDDAIVLIGSTVEQAQKLRQHFGLRQLAHYNPPMGFIRDPAAVEQCLEFIEAHSPFRFCLLAVGAPQQEVVAQRLAQRGKARGLALCIGAAVNFITGAERRAPMWMQKLGLEWLYRLLSDPRRLARRYLLRGPRMFSLLQKTQFVLRPASAN